MDPATVDRCPSCGEPIPLERSFCFECRWRRADGIPPALAQAAAARAARTDDEPTPVVEAVPDPPSVALQTAAPWTLVEEPRRVAGEPMPPVDAPTIAFEVPQETRAPNVVPGHPARAHGISDDDDDVMPLPPPGGDAREPMPLLPLSVALALLAAFVGGVLRLPSASPGGGRLLARTTVGPNGDTIGFDAGARLVVPPGALAAPRTIEIRGVVSSEPRTLPGGQVVQGLYTFAPRDVRFLVPVQVVVPLTDPRRPGEIVVRAGDVVHHLPGKVDLTAGTLTVSTLDLAFREVVP